MWPEAAPGRRGPPIRSARTPTAASALRRERALRERANRTRPRRLASPTFSASTANSRATRLLPMPASPTTLAMQQALSSPRGVSRLGHQVRVDAHQRRLVAAAAAHAAFIPSKRRTRMGASPPLTRTSSGSSSTAAWAISRAVESPTLPTGRSDGLHPLSHADLFTDCGVTQSP